MAEALRLTSKIRVQIDCAMLYLINVQLAFTIFRVSQVNAYHMEAKVVKQLDGLEMQ